MNSFGRLFRINIFGESHGGYVGVCIDGLPPGILLKANDFEADLERRKPLQKGTTQRIESDVPIIISGLYNEYTTGAPLTIIFENNNRKSNDYDNIAKHFRPGHADFSAYIKYKGFNDNRGGGHFSGRLTLPIVAAGVIAKKIISPIIVEAKIVEIGGKKDFESVIEEASIKGDSVGGIIECKATNMIAGLGEPFFDSLESLLSHAMFSIPAVKGIEFGTGFKLASMFGSDANDCFTNEEGKTLTNHHGGILGGISSGNDILFRLAIKPTSSIAKQQNTFNWETKTVELLEIKGRHDTCIALRIPVIVEALTAIVLADCILVNNAFSK
jgi:chorismate synthase